jgi:hypothetical protein
MGVWSASRPGPGERTPGTHWTGGWVGLRPGLDTEAREKKTFYSVGNRTPAVQSLVGYYTDRAAPAPTCALEIKTLSVKFVKWKGNDHIGRHTHLLPGEKQVQKDLRTGGKSKLNESQNGLQCMHCRIKTYKECDEDRRGGRWWRQRRTGRRSRR